MTTFKEVILSEATPVLTVHASYVANDYVGTSADAIEFTDVVRSPAAVGVIQSAILIDYALQSIAGELWLFDTDVTPPDDSAAWTITDAHSARLLGVIPFSTYYANAANSVSQANNVGITIKTLANSRSIYGCFVTRGAPTYADGDLTFRLFILPLEG